MINNKLKTAGIIGLATAMLLGVHVSAAHVPSIWGSNFIIRDDFEFDEADEMNYDDPKHIQLSNENNDLDLYRFIPTASGIYEINVSNKSSDYLVGIIDFEKIKDYQEVDYSSENVHFCSMGRPEENRFYYFETGKTYYVFGWTTGQRAKADYWLSLVNFEGEGNPYGCYGWIERGGGLSYVNEDGKLAEGLTMIDGKWYFFDEDKVSKTGWVSDSGNWYYLDSSGALFTGWQQITGNWYFFSDSGAMITGWKQDSGNWYFFSGSGAMVTGWQQISGKWYFFSGSGAMVTGWQQISGNWYFLSGSGAMVTGWQKISGNWYLFNGSGAMLTGWQKSSGKWYYMDHSSGAMKTGWLLLSGKWYYLDTDGSMITGTKTIGGKAYTFDSNGVCQNP